MGRLPALYLVCRYKSSILAKSGDVSNLNLTKLGLLVRKHRLAAGYSQESFAAECGIHRTYIGSIERGERNITLNTLYTVCNALSIKPSSLLEELDERG